MVIAVDLPARDRALATAVTARARDRALATAVRDRALATAVRDRALATVIEIVVMGRDSVVAVVSVDGDAEDHAGARSARSVSIT
jgi:hypothetical protein